ncbi:MAG: antitoxin family protein [Candidatus Entotheonellia bacterium]
MANTIRARVRGGMLEPLEALEMLEGEVVTITSIRLPAGEAAGELERSAGGWKDLIDMSLCWGSTKRFASSSGENADG